MTKVKKITSLLFSAPVFFAVAFVLALYLENIGELSPDKLVIPLTASVIFAVLGALVFRKVFGGARGDIFSSVFVVMFFSYEAISSAVIAFTPAFLSSYFDKMFLSLVVYLVVLESSFLVVKASRGDLSGFVRYLTIVSVVATAIPFLQIVAYQIDRPGRAPETFSGLPMADPSYLKYLPDIYYIVPDSYPAPWVLKKYFGYDDGAFVSSLERNNFYVSPSQTSNYPVTFLSLTSTLNMQYLDQLEKYKDISEQSVVAPMIQDNRVVRFLKSLGYKYYHLGSWWDLTSYNPIADDNFINNNKRAFYLGEFGNAVVESSVIKPIASVFFPSVQDVVTQDYMREVFEYQFNKLPEIAEKKGPKFVFVHVLAQHYSFFLGPDCESASYKDLVNKSDEEKMLSRITCVNKKIDSAVDSILGNYRGRSEQPVILIQSDEGPHFFMDRLTPKQNWSSASDSMLQQKFPVFAAFYAPGVSRGKFYPGMSSVNSFRVILNEYFGTKLPLLPDRNYIFLDRNHFYVFKEVTPVVVAGLPGNIPAGQ